MEKTKYRYILLTDGEVLDVLDEDEDHKLKDGDRIVYSRTLYHIQSIHRTWNSNTNVIIFNVTLLKLESELVASILSEELQDHMGLTYESLASEESSDQD